MKKVCHFGAIGIVVSLTILLLANLLACAKPAPTGETIELRYGTDESPAHQRYQELVLPFHREIEEYTNSQVTIISYPAESLVTAEQVYDSIMTGVVDMGDCNTMDNPGRFILHEAVIMPGLGVTSPEISTRTVWELHNKFPEVKAEFAGVKIFWLVVKPATHIFSNKPIRSIEDLKGMKIRSYAGPSMEAMRLLGGTPVNVKWNDVYQLMERNGIDGFMTNMTAIVPKRLYEVCKYATYLPLGGIVNWGGMSLERFNKFPKDVQDVFNDIVGDNLVDKFATYHEEWNNRDADEVATKYGIEEIILDPAEFAVCQQLIASVPEKWGTEMDAKGLPGTEIVKFIRERFVFYYGK
ncbi:TRAP transporter substrate-binding protein DctP [Chloroflexota bacterium]